MSGFGLYVHWPFCAKKCPYCDFNSHVRVSLDEVAWLAGIVQEMNLVATLQGETRPQLETIFFGGGTPSLMAGASAARIIDEAAKLWTLAPDVEISIEANPASAESARFADYAAAGVNRLSLGVQSLRDASLKFLGRLHDVDEAKAALKMALATFPRVSFDLIYTLPGQTLADWRTELGEALSFGSEHLSLYQLTIEPITPFATMVKRGKLTMPPDETSVALFEATQEMTASAGLPGYEVSNHARPGAECRHNLIYWQYGQYAGVGPGAHGRLDIYGGRYASAGERLPERWYEKVTQKGHGFATIAEVPPEDAAREHLLMNLRLAEGLDLEAYRARWGFLPPEKKIAQLSELGLVTTIQGRLKATAQGLLLLNRIIEELAD
ncbi:MAG: radical SAM family heme chaperone HemW [Rhizomicrobium sp.]